MSAYEGRLTDDESQMLLVDLRPSWFELREV